MNAPAARIALCGPLTAEIAGRRVEPALPGRKGRLLFAHLVLERGRPVGRDELIDAIWEESPPADPDAAFSTLLTRLRSAIGAEAIQGRRELTLALGDDAWIDWEAARDSLGLAESGLGAGDAAGALAAARRGLEIACRPLLPDLRTGWIEERRRELAELHAALLEAAARAALRIGGEQLPAAERHARELIAREPYRESAYGLLMEAHVARGNVAEALRAYDGLRQLLRGELGLTPAPAITALATRLLAEPEPAPPPREPSPRRERSDAEGNHQPTLALPAGLTGVVDGRLVGRGSELRELQALSTSVLATESRAVLITGEAGIGKTRLAAELALHARSEGFAILHGGVDRHGVTPYQPFVEALRRVLAERPEVGREVAARLQPELAELGKLVPELRFGISDAPDPAVVDPELRRHRVFTAVSALLSSLMQDQPLLLVVDDLQWADAATLLLLRHVVRSSVSERLLVVATIRNDEALPAERRAFLLDLVRQGHFRRLKLGRLTTDEARELVAAGAGDAAGPPATARLWTEAGGNPSLLKELARRGESEDIPSNIQDDIDCRMLELSATANSVITAAAAVGPCFGVSALSDLVGATEHEVAAALSDGLRAGLIVQEARRPGQFCFRHAIARRAVVAAALSDPRTSSAADARSYGAA